jgi:hypothetical protein
MKGTPGLIAVSSGQHRPSNAGELVGEGDHQHVAMQRWYECLLGEHTVAFLSPVEAC